MFKKYLAALVAVSVAGCATSSKDVTASYVSPIQYQAYDCDQLTAEDQRLKARVSQMAGRLDEAASNDKAITGVGMILFWPALFALGGTKQQEAEYARIKGEHDALQQAYIMKKCAPPASQAAEAKPEAKAEPVADKQPAKPVCRLEYKGNVLTEVCS